MLVLMYRSWVLNEILIIDLSSTLISMLLIASKLFLFSNKAHLNSGARLLLELPCCLLYYLCEITSNNGIHIYLSGCKFGVPLFTHDFLLFD